MPNWNPPEVGWDMADPHLALASFLETLPTPPRILALGEPRHDVEAFPAWRNRIFRVLVEDHGFRSIALESDIIAGARVNAHVTASRGTLEDVMHTGFSHGFGALPANRALVEWMRDFNTGREPDARLHFYGFDPPLEFWAPSPRASLLALHEFLSTHLGNVPVDTATIEGLCGEEARWTNPATVMDPAQSIGDSTEARHLRLLADELSVRLQIETPSLVAQPGFWEAQLHARTATGLLRYHMVMADPAPDRLTRLSALRDLMMADNLSAVAGREQRRGPTLVFAHNNHLQRDISVMNMAGMRLQWWSAGAQVSLRLGPQYAFIAGEAGPAVAGGPEHAEPDTSLKPVSPAILFSSRGQLDWPVQDGDPSQAAQHRPLRDGVLVVDRATP